MFFSHNRNLNSIPIVFMCVLMVFSAMNFRNFSVHLVITHTQLQRPDRQIYRALTLSTYVRQKKKGEVSVVNLVVFSFLLLFYLMLNHNEP